jgi:hypothetical protein
MADPMAWPTSVFSPHSPLNQNICCQNNYMLPDNLQVFKILVLVSKFHSAEVSYGRYDSRRILSPAGNVPRCPKNPLGEHPLPPEQPGPRPSEEGIAEMADNINPIGLQNAIKVEPDPDGPLAPGVTLHPDNPRLKVRTGTPPAVRTKGPGQANIHHFRSAITVNPTLNPPMLHPSPSLCTFFRHEP